MEKLFGEIQYVPGVPFCYARVSVPQRGGIPLSLKATLGPYKWRDFKKGDVVEVERASNTDARRYRVTQIVGSPRQPEKQERKQDMSQGVMSKDRVCFFLSHYYYDSGNGMAMQEVLSKAFGMGLGQSIGLMQDNSWGFWITCRPSQFARFMIYRNAAGMKNGFMDLKAELVEQVAVRNNPYDRIADDVNLPWQSVKLVLDALGLSKTEVSENLKRVSICPELDVSQNPAKKESS